MFQKEWLHRSTGLFQARINKTFDLGSMKTISHDLARRGVCDSESGSLTDK